MSQHLSDPLLAPFLAPSFSVHTYLNSAFPLLTPPSFSPSPSRRAPPNTSNLADVSTRATTLLSTLDLQTQRLITTLQTLTDEILRVGPRLGYEVDLLRSDVVSLGESLDAAVKDQLLPFESKPPQLERLHMLSRVRERLEEVVRIFGDAMDWSLDAAPDASAEAGEGGSAAAAGGGGAGGGTGAAMPEKAKRGKGPNPSEEIVYLVASEELDKARAKLEELRKLAGVFEGTVEGPARAAVVDALAERVRAAMEKRNGGKEVVASAEKEGRGEEREEEESLGWMGGTGYGGLIGQLSRMRGIS